MAEDLNALAYGLEQVILDHLHNGITFNVDEVETAWKKIHPDISFKSVLTKLFAQNKVGMASSNTFEYRNIDRTD